ncbi:DUF4344 domain-containing metallopeptidase [Enterovibrio norvegicus]|uniref:DUF4344 domain-containing metallopeptidase n=1 Tax=Enterovibrio norvegicus TaxID=188144 RepID=UPI0010BF1C17|nr:DUF4344 domain-containing metallopeptidase [Enterovibrio norvegicus]TKF30865.1 hypothetical protein FCV83_17800 [Enterovibrio norvegicus]
MRLFIFILILFTSQNLSARTEIEVLAPQEPGDEYWQALSKEVAKELVDFANTSLPINDELTLQLGGNDGPLFDPQTLTIQIPYFFLEEIHQRYSNAEPVLEDVSADEATQFALLHTLLHEYGHAYIFSWDIPIVGKEEDAVDNFATIILLDEFDNDHAAFVAADLFALEDLDTDAFTESHLWGEHSLDAQRYAASLCLIYGSNPEKYADLLNDELHDMNRDLFCVEEYESKRRNWSRIIHSYSKEK